MTKKRKIRPKPVRIVASTEPRMVSYSPILVVILKKDRELINKIYKKYSFFHQYDMEFATPEIINQMNTRELKRYKKLAYMQIDSSVNILQDIEKGQLSILYESTFSNFCLELENENTQ